MLSIVAAAKAFATQSKKNYALWIDKQYAKLHTKKPKTNK